MKNQKVTKNIITKKKNVSLLKTEKKKKSKSNNLKHNSYVIDTLNKAKSKYNEGKKSANNNEEKEEKKKEKKLGAKNNKKNISMFEDHNEKQNENKEKKKLNKNPGKLINKFIEKKIPKNNKKEKVNKSNKDIIRKNKKKKNIENTLNNYIKKFDKNGAKDKKVKKENKNSNNNDKIYIKNEKGKSTKIINNEKHNKENNVIKESKNKDKKNIKKKKIKKKKEIEKNNINKNNYEVNKKEKKNYDNSLNNDEIVVDFELIDPIDTYKDNIRILLRNTELYNDIKFSEKLISIICDQQNIGKFVCVSNEKDNIISFLTIINLNQYDEIKSLKEFLLSKIKKINAKEFQESIKELTKLISSNKNVGLLINSRIINCPIKLIPLIHKNVIDDISWSQDLDDMDEDEKKFYFFDYILFYTKVYKNLNDELIFSNFEEQYFFEHKIHYVMWNNNNIKKFYEIINNKKKEMNYKEYVIIFAIPFDKINDAINKFSLYLRE
ncbi:protein BCP1, putative [Plasmodium relictum]|uniref:Protein BCP1, putative n=1 Tax=Plasmodium relictum TaxID=85471 RepID=A0A1J1H866_PLARL|nr:protein BCP1, putative [Plasmodium relictum]CRH01160.1 protein BCP1, putative [Plasmodium relictum]